VREQGIAALRDFAQGLPGLRTRLAPAPHRGLPVRKTRRARHGAHAKLECTRRDASQAREMLVVNALEVRQVATTSPQQVVMSPVMRYALMTSGTCAPRSRRPRVPPGVCDRA